MHAAAKMRGGHVATMAGSEHGADDASSTSTGVSGSSFVSESEVEELEVPAARLRPDTQPSADVSASVPTTTMRCVQGERCPSQVYVM